ncbi:MAG: SDR family NAD(P)-dependent oxidoreductase [Bacteroidetes bacterium]|nr:SDR family NAD(P)-dependent oxidoreductase [Bacteroidota bacterium]
MLESLSLEGKTVVITGGGTGLGRAMVRAMARAGADLVIAGRRTGPIEEAAAEAALARTPHRRHRFGPTVAASGPGSRPVRWQ